MGKWALCPPSRFHVEPPRPLRRRFLGLGPLALRLELLHRLGEGDLQAFRERWGTDPGGGEWLQERCLFRFWPLRARQFGLWSLWALPFRV